MSRSTDPVAGVILASGMSRRFGNENKLLVPLGGRPLVRRVVSVYLAAALDPVLVVVGHQAERVREALNGLAVQTLDNPDFTQGQSRALVRGIGALPRDTGAAVIGVADQPFLTAETIRRVVDAWRATGAPLAVPRYAGNRGNPVLFDRSLFMELLAVEGDQGGRAVIARHADRAVWVDLPGGREAADVDTEDDFRALQPPVSG